MIPPINSVRFSEDNFEFEKFRKNRSTVESFSFIVQNTIPQRETLDPDTTAGAIRAPAAATTRRPATKIVLYYSKSVSRPTYICIYFVCWKKERRRLEQNVTEGMQLRIVASASDIVRGGEVVAGKRP